MARRSRNLGAGFVSALQQPSLLDPTWPCPLCEETGHDPYFKGGIEHAHKPCPMCRGARRLDFDPEDFSEIPF